MGRHPIGNRVIQTIAGKIWGAAWQSGAMGVQACAIGLPVNEGRQIAGRDNDGSSS